MKYTVLIVGLMLSVAAPALAVCSGGFDGNGSDTGCTEMGALGDLIYERDASGRVVHKRTNDEIRHYLVTTVEQRLQKRGITMKNKNDAPVISIGEEKVTFDLFNQNGDKIYTYTVDVEKGVPENEKNLIVERDKYKARFEQNYADEHSRLKRMQAVAEKIKSEELKAKAVGK